MSTDYYTENKGNGNSIEMVGVPADTPSAEVHATAPFGARGGDSVAEEMLDLVSKFLRGKNCRCTPMAKAEITLPEPVTDIVGGTGYPDVWDAIERLARQSVKDESAIRFKDHMGRQMLLWAMLHPSNTVIWFQRYKEDGRVVANEPGNRLMAGLGAQWPTDEEKRFLHETVLLAAYNGYRLCQKYAK